MTEHKVALNQDKYKNNFNPNRVSTISRANKGNGGDITLRSTKFRKERERGWSELDEIVSKVEKKGMNSLDIEDIQKLPLLYRNVISSLSVARNIVLDRNLLLYLENLSLRAYLVVYGPRISIGDSLKIFFSRSFPRYVREVRKHLLLSFLIFSIGILVGLLLVNSDITNFHLFIPESLADGRGPDSTRQELLDTELFAPWPGYADTFIHFANFLFRHNTMVGILCFVVGFALGIPTALLLLNNGLAIGAFISLHIHKGLGVAGVGWLSIHGVTEILAILLCSAAGFLVAEKIIFPGKHTRLESLAIYGRKAGGIVAGCVVLFFIAGILEGGFRQLVASTSSRFFIAGITAIFWLYYFTMVGRQEDE